MAAPWIDLTGSHHARTIIAKMNKVNKIETFVRTNFFDLSEGLRKTVEKQPSLSYAIFILMGIRM